jgi:hypothetical protein
MNVMVHNLLVEADVSSVAMIIQRFKVCFLLAHDIELEITNASCIQSPWLLDVQLKLKVSHVFLVVEPAPVVDNLADDPSISRALSPLNQCFCLMELSLIWRHAQSLGRASVW